MLVSLINPQEIYEDVFDLLQRVKVDIEDKLK